MTLLETDSRHANTYPNIHVNPKFDYPLHVTVLRRLMKWYFTLDHYNYARWLSVHLFDLVCLPYTCPDGFFTFQKTRSEFSNMALDQVHEQNNEFKRCR